MRQRIFHSATPRLAALALGTAGVLGLVAAGPATLTTPVAAATPPPPGTATPPKPPADPGAQLAATLVDQVTIGGIFAHLAGFERLAQANGGVRTAGTRGFDQSADYVAERLHETGYQVTRQSFEFPYFQERRPTTLAQTAPAPIHYRGNTDFEIMTYSGSGTVQAAVHPVDLNLTPPRASTSGCESADFAGFPRGQIALMQRGSCDFAVKVRNATAAGARGAIIFNQGNGDPRKDADRFNLIAGTLTTPATIPTLGVTYAVGAQLATTAGAVVRLDASLVSETRTTQNLIAETPEGRADNVVMAGAHLDSVPRGPGINDNGTGSATLLELALKYAPLAHTVKPVNKVRFAWWGAEEEGLLGSTHYVDQLTPRQVKNIGLYLNLDMLASPNYVLGVQDGDHSTAASDRAPAGSAGIEKLFRAYLTSRGQHAVDADFDGRSDYGPFVAKGIDLPAGGLETGAEGLKTAAEAKLFGGVAGIADDPCYHKACDSMVPLVHHADPATYAKLRAAYGVQLVGNLNLFALNLNAGAIANAVGRLAFDTTGISSPAGR
jgi:Zn-dependent M28 family amino/carboxypeptidase